MTTAPYLLVTHSEDYYCIDLVAAGLARRSRTSLRVDSDQLPTRDTLTVRFGTHAERTNAHPMEYTVDGTRIDLNAVPGVWARRMWPGRVPADMPERYRRYAAAHTRAAFFDALARVPAFWLNDIEAGARAEKKLLQLERAAYRGLSVPPTLVSNDPDAVRAFYDEQNGDIVTKLLGALSQTMNATGDFVYTSRVTPEDMASIADVHYAPQIFQRRLDKRCELRVIAVGDRFFTGAIDAQPFPHARIDWRQLKQADGAKWFDYALPTDVQKKTRRVLDDLGLVYGAVDLIVTPDGDHVFLEVNPAGEWGFIEKNLGHPIGDALAETLIEGARRLGRDNGPALRAEQKRTPKPKQVLIVTKTDDNHCIKNVSQALLERGAKPIRLNSDRYPTHAQITTSVDGTSVQRMLIDGGPGADISDIDAVWYRRFHAGRFLPAALGDTQRACLGETRRTLFGTLGALRCFHLDHLENVRRCDHKEMQLLRAAHYGLDVPATLFSNDPAAVHAFYDAQGGQIITKMQHSFAIYRDGIENVVFTNVLDRADLDDLSGLKYCPMSFQEHLDKRLELRATVVGQEVFCASIDSQKQQTTLTDWRRDGVGLINDWQPYTLEPKLKQGLLNLVAEVGLNYAAADFVITKDGRCVFLEINAVGEYFWLERAPGLPISEAIADVLLGHRPRLAVDAATWANFTLPASQPATSENVA